MRRFYNPTEDELHTWADDPAAREPMQDWDLVLSWQVDRPFLELCIKYASDPNCPKAGFFFDILYLWVDTVARDNEFVTRRELYNNWLDLVRGGIEPRVKRWRYQARLVFQSVEPFDREEWLAAWQAEREVA